MSDVLVIAPADQQALDQGQAALLEATYHGWLRSLPSERVIGVPRHSTHCPLCRFLYEQTGRRWLIDSRRAYLIDTLAYALVLFYRHGLSGISCSLIAAVVSRLRSAWR